MDAVSSTGTTTDTGHLLLKRWVAWLIASLFLLCLSSNSLAAPRNVLVLYESEKPFVTELIHSIKEHITDDIHIHFQKYQPDTPLSPEDKSNRDLIIGIGYRISKSLSKQKLQLPILNLLVPLTTTSQFRSNSPRYASLVIDQPFSRQFLMIREAFGNSTRTGLVTGKSSARLKDQIKNAAQQNHIPLNYSHIDNSEELIAVLKQLFSNSEVLLVTPDPLIYNRKTIRSILLLSYRQRIPVIGYTQSYTKAGAAIAMYSTASQIGEHTSEIIYDFFNAGKKFNSNIIEPRYFSIDINQKVSRSLGLDLPDANVLKKKIHADEIR